ncbi:hypothetical protein ACO2RV_11600 [Ancylobacter sp. VNQ12]|uniref:hypothetical protein n=1 Tax=Ancylobacter sp. VNQ12 TaxID=3400920 RepID=UPI003C04E0A2
MNHASAGDTSPLFAIDDLRAFGKNFTEDATELSGLAFEITPDAIGLATQPAVPVGDDGSLIQRLSDMLELLWEMEANVFAIARRIGLPEIYSLDQG